MKTLKSLIVTCALLGGLATYSHSRGCEPENGWNVTYVTGTAATIFEGRAGYLKKIVLSTNTTESVGAYLIAMSSAPSAILGAGNSVMPNHLFLSTTALTPAIMYNTTATANSGFINNFWEAGGYGDCIRVPGPSPDGTGRVGGGLYIRQSDAASGNARSATVYWGN